MSLSALSSSDGLGLHDCKKASQSTLSGEINADSILAVDKQIREHERAVRALEEQIREHERATIELKRARNSLLNISKLPPEVLGNIFRWNVSFENDFGGLEEGSHDFLFVCHHWSEVASHTSGLWSFWGNNLKDWARWCRRSGTAPLDLVLDGVEYGVENFDTILHNALQDHATADTIRRVHLKTYDRVFLSTIIASLTAECEGTRSNSVGSLVLRQYNSAVDLSDFFAHYRFPKLRRLDLLNCTTSSWDHLTSRTGALTYLTLDLSHPESGPTTSQLLSILASNPILQRLTLSNHAVPNDDGGQSSFRVPLRHLKKLDLSGDSRDVMRFLHWLDHPASMDHLSLALRDWTVAEIPQVIVPYFRDYLNRRGRSQNGLGFSLCPISGITLSTGDACRTSGPLLAARPINTFVEITLCQNEELPRDAQENAILDLISYVLQEEIVYFRIRRNSVAMGKVYAQFPNLKTLSLAEMPLSAAFPRPNPAEDEGILPSLRWMFLQELVVDVDYWSPLTTFLARRASSGSRLYKLEISRSSHMCPEVVESISGAAQQVKIEDPGPVCPFEVCS